MVFMYQLVSNCSFNELIAERYQVIKILKKDGCLQSVLAEDIQDASHRKCLIKQLIKVDSHSPYIWGQKQSFKSLKRQLNKEAEILYKLENIRGIPQILACFKANQNYYLVQEFIEGKPLMDEFPMGKRDQKIWTEKQCLEMLQEVLGILQIIHENNAIHCNLNPNNLIRRTSDGALVLINFSAVQPVRPLKEIKPLTLPMGTFGYLPPEQLANYPQPNSDLYALGLIAIEALTGMHPGQLKVNSYTGKISWQEELLSPVSEELVRILDLMVLSYAQKRYQSVTEVQQAIASLVCPEKQPLILDATKVSPPLEVVEAEATATNKAGEPFDSITETAKEAGRGKSEAEIAQIPPADISFETSLLTASTETPAITDLSAQTTLSPRRKYGAYFFLVIFMITSIIINSLIGCFGLIELFKILPSDLGKGNFIRAQELYQSGDLTQAIALAKSVRWDSSAYQDAQNALQQWQVETEKAIAKFEVIQTAFQESRWLEVLSLAAEMPAISYWQDRIAPLVASAALKVAPEAQEFLQQAYNKASQRDFIGAIQLLKQIPYQTPVYQTAQAKILEYEQKQQIKLETEAYQLLKQAYQKAEAKDFAGALTLLEKIPAGTPTYARVQEKITEYQNKRQIKGNALLQQAYNRAAQKDYAAAIEILKQIPSQTTAYQIAQGKISEYSLKLRYQITNRSRRQMSHLRESDFLVTASCPSFNPGEYFQEVNI